MFLKYVNSRMKTRPDIGHLTQDDTYTESDEDTAEVFNNYLRGVFTVEITDTSLSSPPLSNTSKWTTTHELIDLDICVQDVADILGKLNCSKSPGPDSVHPAVLKECRNKLAYLQAHVLLKHELVDMRVCFWNTTICLF